MTLVRQFSILACMTLSARRHGGLRFDGGGHLCGDGAGCPDESEASPEAAERQHGHDGKREHRLTCNGFVLLLLLLYLLFSLVWRCCCFCCGYRFCHIPRHDRRRRCGRQRRPVNPCPPVPLPLPSLRPRSPTKTSLGFLLVWVLYLIPTGHWFWDDSPSAARRLMMVDSIVVSVFYGVLV